MIEHLPLWINLLFIVTTLTTILFFHLSNGKPSKITGLIMLWASLHSVLAYSGFYQDTAASPPRFIFLLPPVIILMAYSLLSKHRNGIINNRNLHLSTILHIIRIPVELVLLQLYLHKMIPRLMTFEGRNFDILIGITASIIYFLFVRKLIGKKGLLVWNVIGLLFVSFILVNGLLSAELPFQQFAFEQPNKALNYFPFILLPGVIVPIVIWTHITDIIKLRREIAS